MSISANERSSTVLTQRISECNMLLVFKKKLYLHSRNIGSYIHCVSKNVPPLTCYNLDTHDLITIVFARSVTKKVRNQTRLCFPTSPIYWFCTTLWNRKPRNCIFSLKHCMLLCQRTHKTHWNYHLVTVELPFIPKVIDCMHQTV